MTDSGSQGEQLWEIGWEGHRLAQTRRLARLSLAEKLEWLEDAQRVVQHLRQSAMRPPSKPGER